MSEDPKQHPVHVGVEARSETSVTEKRKRGKESWSYFQFVLSLFISIVAALIFAFDDGWWSGWRRALAFIAVVLVSCSLVIFCRPVHDYLLRF